MNDDTKCWIESLGRYGLDARLLLDLATVRDEVRPFGLWHCPLQAVPLVYDLCQSWGLHAREARRLWSTCDPGSRERILCDRPIHADDLRVAEMWFSKLKSFDLTIPGDPGNHLCYPRCCIQRYSKVSSFKELFVQYLTDVVPGDWLINRLAGLFSPYWLSLDYLPCSLSCLPSREMAQKTAEVARATLGDDYFQTAELALKAPLIILDGQLIWCPSWERLNNSLNVDIEMAKSLDLRTTFAPITEEIREGLIPFTHFDGISKIMLVGSRDAATLSMREERWI